MEVVTECCCGLDVHQAAITACLVKARRGVRTERVFREFGTTTREIGALKNWLCEAGCTHVVMESTGVYWLPVYNVLEDSGLELVVGNAQHIKNVPGRKTDVRDAEWLADLVRHGLIRKSFVPS